MIVIVCPVYCVLASQVHFFYKMMMIMTMVMMMMMMMMMMIAGCFLQFLYNRNGM